MTPIQAQIFGSEPGSGSFAGILGHWSHYHMVDESNVKMISGYDLFCINKHKKPWFSSARMLSYCIDYWQIFCLFFIILKIVFALQAMVTGTDPFDILKITEALHFVYQHFYQEWNWQLEKASLLVYNWHFLQSNVTFCSERYLSLVCPRLSLGWLFHS